MCCISMWGLNASSFSTLQQNYEVRTHPLFYLSTKCWNPTHILFDFSTFVVAMMVWKRELTLVEDWHSLVGVRKIINAKGPLSTFGVLFRTFVKCKQMCLRGVSTDLSQRLAETHQKLKVGFAMNLLQMLKIMKWRKRHFVC